MMREFLIILIISAANITTNADAETVMNPDGGNSNTFDLEGFVPDEELYRELDDATFEDDMIFLKSNQRMATSTAKLWPGGIVPYIISPNVTASLRQVIDEAVKYVNKYTCITFRDWVKTDTYWVRFVKDPSPSKTKLCSSFVGWLQKKDQGIFLGPKCVFGSMVHEMLHALGFNHEHTRNDREQYIRVNKSNFADNSTSSNYALDSTRCKNGPCAYLDYQVNYNYESIMHYCPRCACRNPKCPVFTIVPQNQAPNRKTPTGSTAKIGQREGFSRGDWLMVNRRYKCNIGMQEDPPPISENPIKQEPYFEVDVDVNIGGGGDICPSEGGEMEGDDDDDGPLPVPPPINGGKPGSGGIDEDDDDDFMIPMPPPINGGKPGNKPGPGGIDEDDDFIEDD